MAEIINGVKVEPEVYTDTYANQPGNLREGNLFLPSDGFVLERDTGTAWSPWGPIFPFTPPVLGDFTWVNQDASATAVTTNGGIYLHSPANASIEYRILKKSAPTPPYVITAYVIAHYYPENYASWGIGFRQSSDGKLHLLRCIFNAAGALDHQMTSLKCTDEHTDSADYLAINLIPHNQLFLRIEDDNTNRKLYYGYDGQNFQQLDSQGRTNFLTADEVLFWVTSRNANRDVGMTLLHWLEE